MTSSGNKEAPPQESEDVVEPPYSIFSGAEKVFYAWVASMAAFSSPVSSNIYYPALTVLASDLHTSVGNINLTITTYMVCSSRSATEGGSMLTLRRFFRPLHRLLLEESQTDGVEGRHISFALPYTSPRIPGSPYKQVL
jgi:hypothetical protein